VRSTATGAKGADMRRLLLVTTLMTAFVVNGILASPVSADPSAQGPNTLTCTTQSGQLLGTIDLNPGALPNRSHEGFVVTATSFADSNSIFVLSNGSVIIGGTTITFIDTPAPANKNLVTCSGDVGGGVILSLTGFFTPPG
jgi:hypothetical protein